MEVVLLTVVGFVVVTVVVAVAVVVAVVVVVVVGVVAVDVVVNGGVGDGEGDLVVLACTVTFMVANTFLPLFLLPPHTYSSTSHLEIISLETSELGSFKYSEEQKGKRCIMIFLGIQ